MLRINLLGDHAIQRLITDSAVLFSERYESNTVRSTRDYPNSDLNGLRLVLILAGVNSKQESITSYLFAAELREPDPWLQADYRLAQFIVWAVAEGEREPYRQSFLKMYGYAPELVVGWWRDRQQLALLAEKANCSTPLLVANQAAELLALIPDYDLSAVPDCPPKKPAAPSALSLAILRDRGAGRKKAS